MSTLTSPAFGRVLRQRRLEHGLTQAALAEAAGVHLNYVSLLERGLRVPSLDVVLHLARALTMSGAEIVAEVEAVIGEAPSA